MLKKLSMATISCAVLLFCTGLIRAQEPDRPPQTDAHRPELVLVRMMIRAEDMAEGEALSLYREDDEAPLQTLRLDDRCEAATEAIAPGDYRVVTAHGGEVRFTLRENASIAVRSGEGWSDGEMLCLSSASVCSLRIVRRTDGGTLYTYNLVGGGRERGNILHTDSSTESGTCQYFGLPEGTYRLYENGTAIACVTLSAQSPVQTLHIGYGDRVLTQEDFPSPTT